MPLDCTFYEPDKNGNPAPFYLKVTFKHAVNFDEFTKQCFAKKVGITACFSGEWANIKTETLKDATVVVSGDRKVYGVMYEIERMRDVKQVTLDRS